MANKLLVIAYQGTLISEGLDNKPVFLLQLEEQKKLKTIFEKLRELGFALALAPNKYNVFHEQAVNDTGQ